jgi:enterochelin esterase-like enzyme
MIHSKLLFGVMLLFSLSCNKTSVLPKNSVSYNHFKTLSELKETLYALGNLSDENTRTEKIDAFWDSLKANKEIPFTRGDSVAFLYRGNSSSVKWVGDFNNWSTSGANFEGILIPNTDIWILEKSFPDDARLDYKLYVNGSWILDPDNPFIQHSGFGPNSELRMPAWVYPEETIPIPGATKGTLSNNRTIFSPNFLKYFVNYKVYLPHNYDLLDALPVIYVTDGHEYTDDKLGNMVTVLDNLIYQEKISPVIAIFIDPREPGNSSNNRRMFEYRSNIQYAKFVAEELVPLVDALYKTDNAPEKRAILGTSLGGWNSAFFGYESSHVFGLIGIHSPAFDQNIISNYAFTNRLPLKFFMSTGVINDTESQARQMKAVLEQKEYPLHYLEVNQGHSWGNWRGLIGEALIWFFPS